MKHQAINVHSSLLAGSINRVAEDGAAQDFSQMHPDLVRTSCMDQASQECPVSFGIALDNFVVGGGFLSCGLLDNRHPLSMHGVTADSSSNLALQSGRLAIRDSKIFFPRPTLGKLFDEGPIRHLALGCDETS